MDENAERVEFTDEQLRDALKRVGSQAKQLAFSKQRPIFFFRKGCLIALYRDGREEVIRNAEHGANLIGEHQ